MGKLEDPRGRGKKSAGSLEPRERCRKAVAWSGEWRRARGSKMQSALLFCSENFGGARRSRRQGSLADQSVHPPSTVIVAPVM